MWTSPPFCGTMTCAIQNDIFPPVAKLDIAVDSDSKGRGFKSLRAGQIIRMAFHAPFGFLFFRARRDLNPKGRLTLKKAPGAPFFGSRGAGRYRTRSVGWPSRADALAAASLRAGQNETTIFARRLSFLFALFSFRSLFFSFHFSKSSFPVKSEPLSHALTI